MLIDSPQEVQSAPDMTDDAELALLGGWEQEKEVQGATQAPAQKVSGQVPLLDEEDSVTPEEIRQERPWWMRGTWRMVVAGGATLGVLHVMFSLLGLWGGSSKETPSLVATDAAAIDREVTERMQQLETENENLKREQVMGEPLPAASNKSAAPGKVPAQPQVVPASAPPRPIPVQNVASRRPVPYTSLPPPRRIAYNPPPRSLPRPVVVAPTRTSPAPAKEPIDLMQQQLMAANAGSYGRVSPTNTEQIDSSPSEDANYQTASYQDENAGSSLWEASGGTGTPPLEQSDVARANERSERAIAQVNGDREQDNASDRTVNYSTSADSLIVGTKANGKLETPIAWSGTLENPTQNFLIQLNEPLKAADNTVAIPKGAYLVAKIASADQSGLLQMSVSSMLVNKNGRTIEKPVPEGALLILGKGGKPLKASANRPNTNGNNLGTVVLSGVANVAGLVNRPSYQSSYSSNGYQSSTTSNNSNPNYLAGFGEGAAQSLLQQAQNRNQQALRSRESEPIVFSLNQGSSVQIFVNQSVSL